MKSCTRSQVQHDLPIGASAITMGLTAIHEEKMRFERQQF